MRLDDVIHSHATEIAVLRTECDQFVADAGVYPMLRALPCSYQAIQRVKVRQQKRADAVTYVFNEAFSQVYNLRQRAVITHASPIIGDQQEPFYVFPINGYKFLYSKEVKDSASDYNHVIDTVFERFASMDHAAEIVTDVVKASYTDTNLLEGLRAGAEIILYNIPYFYAVKQSVYPDYKTLLTHIHN